MSKYRKLRHVYYECDYHIVSSPKYCFQILGGMVKSLVEHDLQLISVWKDVQIIELNVQRRIKGVTRFTHWSSIFARFITASGSDFFALAPIFFNFSTLVMRLPFPSTNLFIAAE